MEDSYNPPPMWYHDKTGKCIPVYDPTPEQWKSFDEQRKREIQHQQMEHFESLVAAATGPICWLITVVIVLLTCLIILKS